MYRLLKDDWLGLDAAGFAKGRVVVPRFTRLEGGDNYLANPKRAAAGYDPEASVRELARLGFSHVPVNALAKDMPAEQGPPGEIYYRFYYFSPDLDQFVETPLNAGAYSPEYLEANLALLKENARLAVKYGLTPGLNISSPRSVPDAVLEKHPYLRGARVDHPFRSYRPRFTLTLSHPAVRWHYAELVRRLMKEVPDLGYIYLWTNDSGSGFEYTASLYAGRNGGAYLVREWKSHEAVAKAAAENVLRYFRTLRDAALETRPDFRLLFNLFSFSNEEEFILDGLGEGLDLWVAPKELDDSLRGRRLKALPQRGSEIFTTTRLQNNYLLGIPSPWLAAEEVRALSGAGFDKAQVTVDPAPLAPYDVNRDVLRALNFDAGADVDAVVSGRGVPARRRGRRARSRRGLEALRRGRPRLSLDHALRRQQLGFPLVPPARPALRPGHREDPGGRARLLREVHDRDLQQSQPRRPRHRHPLDAHDPGAGRRGRGAGRPGDVETARRAPSRSSGRRSAGAAEARQAVFTDQFDRLRALRCYFRTLRNTAAWVAGVHGYIEAKDPAEKARRRDAVRAMVDDEIANARDLAVALRVLDDAVHAGRPGRRNLQHVRREPARARPEEDRPDARSTATTSPRIDPNFMWRLPPDAGLDPKLYLKYRP